MGKGSVNLVMLIGELVDDPIKDYNASGKESSSFVLRTEEHWIDSEGDDQERIQDHPCTMSDYNAENSNKYLRKGQLVYIEGILEKKKFVNDDGDETDRIEVIVRRFTMLGKKPDRKDELPFDDEDFSNGGNKGQNKDQGGVPPI